MTKKKKTVKEIAIPDDGRGYLECQVAAVMPRFSNPQAAEAALNLALARLGGIKPKDSVEAMLALQMVATHEAALESLRRAQLPGQPLEVSDLNFRHATKLLGIYERQMAALDKHRGRGQQNVTVKYVHVAEGAQAIVGNVTRNGAAAVPEAEAPPALEASTEMPVEILSGAREGPGTLMAGDHPRNTGPMIASPRCGARTRAGTPCRAPAVASKRRCRMHGGAKGSGAPHGNRNALKHGLHSREVIAERWTVRQLIREAERLLREIED